jgi:hypothetical protein
MNEMPLSESGLLLVLAEDGQFFYSFLTLFFLLLPGQLGHGGTGNRFWIAPSKMWM